MSEPQKNQKMGFIDGMRGVAAFYVVLQHSSTMMDPYFGFQRAGAQPGWLAIVMAPFWYGHFAVAAFIVISGFCLQWSLEQRSQGKLSDIQGFMKRRCWRILPPYYACLAFSLLTCWLVTSQQKGMPWAIYLPVTTENFLAHLFLVHNLSPSWMYKINGVLWSIAIEFQLYLLFPVLVLSLNRLRSNFYLVFGLLSITTILVSIFGTVGKLYLWFLPLFFCGMIAARILKREPGLFVLKHSLLIGIALCLVGISGIWFTKAVAIRDSLFGVGVAFLLMDGVQNPHHKWIKFFEWKPILFVGSFSYSLYLMHHLVLQWVFAYRPAMISTPVRELGYLLAIGVPLALVCSYGFYLVFEKPFIKNKSKTKMPD